MKNRLDKEMLSRNLVRTLEKAQAIIMAGEVYVDGQICYKPDRQVITSNLIEIKKKNPFVSRGAFKIKNAVEKFEINPSGLKILDIGISTGGFSDFMLKNGATKVAGVDVNISQVDYNLKKNHNLVLIKQNARFLKKEQLGFEPDLISIDVSFISILKILPPLKQFKNARIIALIKPQFEAKINEVTRGGVIRDADTLLKILLRTKKAIEDLNFSIIGFTSSGLRGRKGNKEFFFLLEYGKKNIFDDKILINGTEI